MKISSIRIAGIVDESIVDGPGIRFAVFTQGCAHACPGCHNPHTHSYTGGKTEDLGALIEKMSANPLLDGLTLTGGEPFDQPYACAVLANAAHDLGLDVWVFSGYEYEELLQNVKCVEFLCAIDVLIDGKFLISEKTLGAEWKGSANQRVIDVAASLTADKVILFE